MTPRRGRPAPPFAVGIFLIAAVAFGLAASLLGGPTAPLQAAPAAAPSTPGFTAFEVAAVIVLLGLVAWFVYRIGLAFRHGTLPVPVHTTMLLLAMFGLGVLFVVVFHLIGGAPLPTSGNQTVNGTGHGTNPPPNPVTPGGNLTGPAGVSIPGWTIYAGFGVAAVAAVVLALPYLVAVRRREDERATAPPTTDDARAALRRALADLDAPTPLDPHRRIIAAYAALLERFEERRPREVDGPLATMTPGDIERVCVARLRVSPPVARELTGLFEEARYSRHALGDEAVGRARAALHRALDDIERSPRRR